MTLHCRSKLNPRRGLTLALPLIALSMVARADYESKAAGIRHYNTSSTCSCNSNMNKPCTEPAVWETYATTFNSRMVSTMQYDNAVYYLNSDVWPQDFVEQGRFGYGADSVSPDGTDWADVIFYAGHSNHRCDVTTRSCAHDSDCWSDETCKNGKCNAYRSQFGMGKSISGQECWPDTMHHILWGNDDANVAIFFSCETVQYCVWNAGGYDKMGTGQFNTLLGFHGDMQLSTDNNTRLDGYLSGTKLDGIGDDWVDELTTIHSGSNNDECATAVVFGSTSSLRTAQYMNGGYKDLKATDSSRSSSIWYISGCDADFGETL